MTESTCLENIDFTGAFFKKVLLHIDIGVGKFYIHVKQTFIWPQYDLDHNICFGFS